MNVVSSHSVFFCLFLIKMNEEVNTFQVVYNETTVFLEVSTTYKF